MATHFNILAWRIPPWTEETGGLHTVSGVTKSRTRLLNFTYFCLLCCAKTLNFNLVHLFIFGFISITLGGGSKMVFSHFMSKSVLPVFSSIAL